MAGAESSTARFAVMKWPIPGIFGQNTFTGLKVLGKSIVLGGAPTEGAPVSEPSKGKTPAGGQQPPGTVEVRVNTLNISKIADRARTRTAAVVFAVTSLALIGPATAGAQQVTDAQYNSTLQLIEQGNDQPPSDSSASGLPFTGLDVVTLFAVGLALALAGFVLWRRSRTSEVGA